jgi:hypothetical protein
MKFFVQMMSGLGVALFFVGAIMRILHADLLLNAGPVAWWRASIFFILVAMLYEIIEIRDRLLNIGEKN